MSFLHVHSLAIIPGVGYLTPTASKEFKEEGGHMDPRRVSADTLFFLKCYWRQGFGKVERETQRSGRLEV